MPSKIVTVTEFGTALLNGDHQYLYVTATGDLHAIGGTVVSMGSFTKIINNGAIASLTESPGGSIAIAFLGGSGTLRNEGLIVADGMGLLVDGDADVRIDNGGTIFGRQYGILVSDAADVITINNNGEISGTYGIAADTDISLVNTGTISGEFAGVQCFLSAAAWLNNSGIISASANRFAVVGGDRADTVLNSGQLLGRVLLQSGDDLYDGRLGLVMDIVDGDQGLDTLLGGNGAETLLGGGGADEVAGFAGNDVIAGGDGADLLDGGDGFDIVSFADAVAPVRADLQNEALNEGEAALDQFNHFEGVIGSDFADTLSGDTLGNELRGGAGTDVLDGRAGTDTLRGGAGNDLITVDNLRDRVLEGALGGADTVTAAVTFRLGGNAEIELLATTDVAGTGAINLTGSLTDNAILGNAGINRLYGLAGSDTLEGRDGNDTLGGGDGNDMLAGEDGNDSLLGEAGFDTLLGGTGNDRLVGGAGPDQMAGGAGLDIFTRNTADSTTAVWDRITDFSSADDLIWLKLAIVPGMPLGGIGGAAFAQGAVVAFTTPSQRIFYSTANGRIFYDADGDGAGGSSLIGELTNVPASIAASDFVIIA